MKQGKIDFDRGVSVLQKKKKLVIYLFILNYRIMKTIGQKNSFISF